MLGVLPGGLGSFEAASVITIHAIDVPTAVALSATLIFRGLSFWLPMLPGSPRPRRPDDRGRGSDAQVLHATEASKQGAARNSHLDAPTRRPVPCR
jgi:hypothetical protein